MKKSILTINLILLFSAMIFAQGGGSVGVSNPIAAGLSNTYVTNSTGVYAVHVNPANLALSPDYEFELATVLPLPTLNVFAGTDFMTINEFNYFFGGVDVGGETVGRYLNEADKDRLRGLFNNGGTFREEFGIKLFSFTFKIDKEIGAIGFSIDDVESALFTIPQGIVDLALEGNPVGKVYNLDGTNLSMSWLRSYSLSYARELTDLFDGTFSFFSAGLSLKMYSGFAYMGVDHINTTFTTAAKNTLIAEGDMTAYAAFSPDFGTVYDFDSSDVDADVGPFPEPAGSGFGFDLGFHAQIDGIWDLGLAFTDIGSMTWDKNVAEYTSQGSVTITDVTDQAAMDSIGDAFTGEGKFIDEVSSSLPTALRLGVSAKVDRLIEGFPGQLVAALDYNQGFNNEPRNSKKPRVSLGLEWRPWDIFPIRTGFTFGGLFGFGWSLGTGIDAGLFEFAIATEHFNNVLNADNADKINVAIGTRWRF